MSTWQSSKEKELQKVLELTNHYRGAMWLSEPLLYRGSEKGSKELTVAAGAVPVFNKFAQGGKISFDQKILKSKEDLDAFYYFAKQDIESGVPILVCIPIKEEKKK